MTAFPATGGNIPRAALVTLACLQTAFLGCIIYGWASISGTLVVAPKEEGGAGLSLQDSAGLFSMATSTTMLASLLLGFALDTFGPRVSSMLGHAMIILGCQIVSFADRPFQYMLGICLIAIGGPGVTSSLFHVTNLFPKRKFLIMSLFNGTANISFCVLAMFDWLWEQFGWSIHNLFRWFTLVVLASAIASWLSWPDKPFEEEEEDVKEEDDDPDNDTSSLLKRNGRHHHPTSEEDLVEATTKHLLFSAEEPLDSFLRAPLPPPRQHKLDRSQSYRYSRVALAKGHSELVSLKDQPFWNQVSSGTFLRSLLVFVVTMFCANFYVASVAMELADERRFPREEQHRLTSYLTFAMSWLGLFGSIFVGWVMDHIGLDWCTAITLLLGQLHMLLLLVGSHSTKSLLVGFGVYTMFRQFLFPTFLATLTSRLGFKYFGILVGLAFTVCGTTQLLMGPLVKVVQGDCHQPIVDDIENDLIKCNEGQWRQWQLAVLLLLGVLLVVPIIDYRNDQRLKQRIKAILETPSTKNLYNGSA